MTDISGIFALFKITMFGLSILVALIYSLLILFIRRCHHRIDILTVNICVAAICTSTFYTVYFTMWEYYFGYLFTAMTCTFLFYIQSVCNCQIPLSLIVLTFNQCCLIKRPGKAFFKTKKFMGICIASQWIAACLMSVPFLLYVQPYCSLLYWMPMYTVVIVVAIPALITLILNLSIFKHAHSSSRRIRQQNNENSTVGTTGGQTPRVSRRDIVLLRHAIFMFTMFLIGWGPIFLLIAIDYKGNVVPLVYTILEIWSVISILICILDLFHHNHELRQYIKNKLCQCF